MTSASDWAGRVGGAWADQWRGTDRSFAGLSIALDAAILAKAPSSGKAVDLGCGAGATSIALATARPTLAVHGVDLSAGLIDAAIHRADAAGLANLRFTVADLAAEAAAIAVDADLLVSRHGVMFFDDPATVFATLREAARPGAALVFSCFRARSSNPWAEGLVAAIADAPPPRPDGDAPGPFAFADRTMVARLLAKASWHDAAADRVDFRYVAGSGEDPVADAVAFLRAIGPVAAALSEAPAAARPAMLDKLATTLQEYREGDEVALPASAWLWTARA